MPERFTPEQSRRIVERVRELKSVHQAERDKLDKVRRYWKGRQKLPAVIPSAAPAEVKEMARIARVNVCDIVVGSLAQSLFVDGFRATTRASDNLPAWDAWQANRLDRWQSGVHRPGLAYGASYASVLPGDRSPAVRGLSPRRMTAMYGEDPDWPVSALERIDSRAFRLFEEGEVHNVGENEQGELVHIDSTRHGLSVPPVVRFLDEVDYDADDEPPADPQHGLVHDEVVLGQVAPLMKLQDQIDMTTFGLLVAQHYSAFRQRYVMGWVAESETQKMQAAASQLWTFEDSPEDIKLGEFSETNLDGYIKSREAALKYAATLSKTPVHELIGEMVNLSAEALAAAEAGRDRKIDERQNGFGESWEQVFELVGIYTGQQVPVDSQVRWRDTSARAFGAIVDGLGKLADQLQVPRRALWERIPGVTDQDIQRWESMAAEGDAFSDLERLLDRQAEPAEPAA